MTSFVSRIRRFQRAVTSEVGALDTSFLGLGRPLGPARVLNAIGGGRSEVAEIRAYLGLDSGLMSRLLRRLETDGLVSVGSDNGDARRRTVCLTAAGEREYASYEALSDAQARRMLDRHPHPDALLDAMDLVATALAKDRITLDETDPRDPAAQNCMAAYYAELSVRFAQGFDVSLSRDPDARDMARPRGAFLVAMSDGLPIGCVGLKGTDKGHAEIKRLWVSPAARGMGLSRRLMTRIEGIARDLGIATLRLDSNSALHEAVALYRRTGWHEIDRFNDDPYPDHFFEKHLT